MDTDEKAYINQQFKNYQENLDKIADLDEQYKDDLSNKKYKKERERIEKENEKISKYLQGKQTEFATDSEGIEYIDEPKNEDEEKVNKWLDFINDFQDRMAIAMGSDNAKQNAFNRVVDNWQFDDAVQGLQDLGKEGKVTEEMLDDPKYDEFIQKLVDLGVVDSADNLTDIALAFNQVSTASDATSDSVKGVTSSLEELSKSLDNIQSAYKSVKSAIEEYNELGYLSVDTYQSLMELEPEYLNMLIDENGNLNLNSEAVQKNTVAYIENMGIKTAQNLIDNVSALSGEAAQLEYLTGVTEENTAVTWENIAAQLVSAEAVSSPEVMTALKNRINAIRQMTEAAKSGVGKGGIDSNSTSTESDELEAFKLNLEKRQRLIDKYKKAVELTDFAIDLTDESDFEGKAELTTRKIEQLTSYGQAMREEFERLATTTPNTVEEACVSSEKE